MRVAPLINSLRWRTRDSGASIVGSSRDSLFIAAAILASYGSGSMPRKSSKLRGQTIGASALLFGRDGILQHGDERLTIRSIEPEPAVGKLESDTEPRTDPTMQRRERLERLPPLQPAFECEVVWVVDVVFVDPIRLVELNLWPSRRRLLGESLLKTT